MKPYLPTVLSVCLLLSSGLVAKSSQVRTISDIPSLPHRVLQRSISPRFYKSLLKAPLEGLVIVRGQLGRTTQLSGLKIVHSELGGKFDSVALDRARNLSVEVFQVGLGLEGLRFLQRIRSTRLRGDAREEGAVAVHHPV